MNVEALITRFPEIKEDLYGEPLLARFAETFGDQLAVAMPPAPCSTDYEAANHYYLKLMNPIAFYHLGLSTREKVLEHIRSLLDRYDADPEGLIASLAPENAAAREVRGPGCE